MGDGESKGAERPEIPEGGWRIEGSGATGDPRRGMVDRESQVDTYPVNCPLSTVYFSRTLHVFPPPPHPPAVHTELNLLATAELQSRG
jgi:hypothetical protein